MVSVTRMTPSVEIALISSASYLDLRWGMVFGQLSPTGVVAPIVVATQCGSGSNSSSVKNSVSGRFWLGGYAERDRTLSNKNSTRRGGGESCSRRRRARH